MEKRIMVATTLKPQLQPALTLLASLLIAASTGGCFSSGPRYQAPFTLANPNERHPIKVAQDESTLDLAVHHGGELNQMQLAQLRGYLQGYKKQKAERLLIRTPSGGTNDADAMRAFEDVRTALRQAGIGTNTVSLETYFANRDPSAPLRLSYLRYVATAPDCPDWSENIARDPQNMPYPDLGCATQRNLAAMVDDPRDLLEPRAETPRPSERRDEVWDKYVKGEPTISKRAPSEHANASEISETGASQ
jgi:pilus assembly protein CpaD